MQAGGAEIFARRAGNVIRPEHSEGGTTVHREIAIDASPWFQPLSYALGQFSQSQQESVTFWTIRPDSLQAVKLKASRHGAEQVTTEAGSFVARKISIALTGLLSRFWRAHYWFREPDGLFVRYEGVNGLPGTPTTTVQLGS